MRDGTSDASDGPRGLAPAGAGLLAATLVLLALAALVLGPGLQPVAGLAAHPDPDLPVSAAGLADGEDADLVVGARVPARLVLERPSPLQVRVEGPRVDGDQDRLVVVRLELDLDEDGAGWVVAQPARTVVTLGELSGTRFELLGFGELPCTEEVGSLTVTVRELAEDGRTGEVTVAVPGASCHPDGVPEAPDALDLQQRVWLGETGDWRAQVRRILTGPPPSERAPAPSRDRPSPAPDADDAGDADETDGPGDEESDGGERDGDGDDAAPEDDAREGDGEDGSDDGDAGERDGARDDRGDGRDGDDRDGDDGDGDGDEGDSASSSEAGSSDEDESDDGGADVDGSDG